AELDERRAELVQHLAEVLAAARAHGRDRLDPLALEQLDAAARRARPRQEVGEAVRLEEVAEPVPDGDLGDLRQPPQVPLRRLRHQSAGEPWLSRSRRRCSTCATRSSSSSSSSLVTSPSFVNASWSVSPARSLTRVASPRQRVAASSSSCLASSRRIPPRSESSVASSSIRSAVSDTAPTAASPRRCSRSLTGSTMRPGGAALPAALALRLRLRGRPVARSFAVAARPRRDGRGG